jgi:hypothetical protein
VVLDCDSARRFGIRAVDHASLRSRTVACMLIGTDGAGKTTLFSDLGLVSGGWRDDRPAVSASTPASVALTASCNWAWHARFKSRTCSRRWRSPDALLPGAIRRFALWRAVSALAGSAPRPAR